MGAILTWFFLQLKRMLLRLSFWIEMTIIVLILIMINTLHTPDSSNLMVGYVCEDFEPDFSGSLLDFVRYQDKSELESALISGKVDCGFFFKNDFLKGLQDDGIKNSIVCMTTPFSLKAEVAKETVYTAVLKERGNRLIMKNISELHTKKEASELLSEKYRERLLQEGIFSVDTVMTKAPSEVDKNIDKRFIAKAFILIMSVLYIIITERKHLLPYYRAVSYMALLSPVVLIAVILL